LETKKIRESTIWGLIVLKVVITGLSVIAEPEQLVTGFKTRQVVICICCS